LTAEPFGQPFVVELWGVTEHFAAARRISVITADAGRLPDTSSGGTWRLPFSAVVVARIAPRSHSLTATS